MKSVIGKRIIKILVFVLAFAGLFVMATKILQEKWYFTLHINSPETENLEAFYEEPEDSIDVIFLGSSHVYNDINPVVFYEETGLTGFDLATSNQDMFISYVLLQEALKTQSPSYVVFDAATFQYGVFARDKYYEMTFDSMKWSKLKWDSLKEWESVCTDQSIWDRVFTIIDYHSRWEELQQADFNATGYATTINGYIPTTGVTSVKMKEYDENDGLWDIPSNTRVYFEKIASLCFENDIELIITLAPDSTTRYGKTEPVKMLAGEYDLSCFDYNDLENFARTGIDTETDFRDAGHLNTFGAIKFTKTLAQDLTGQYAVLKQEVDETNTGWQEKIATWNSVYDKEYLTRVTDIYEYLDLLATSDYTVLAAISDEGTAGLNEELIGKLKGIGFDCDFANGYCKSFIGIVSKNLTWSELSDEVLDREGKFSNGKYWTLHSASLAAGSAANVETSAVITISGTDYAVNGRGISFVVYDEDTDTVLDTICFDTYSQTYDASRY